MNRLIDKFEVGYPEEKNTFVTNHLLFAGGESANRLNITEKTDNPRLIDSIDYFSTRFRYNGVLNQDLEEDDSKIEIVEDPNPPSPPEIIVNPTMPDLEENPEIRQPLPELIDETGYVSDCENFIKAVEHSMTMGIPMIIITNKYNPTESGFYKNSHSSCHFCHNLSIRTSSDRWKEYMEMNKTRYYFVNAQFYKNDDTANKRSGMFTIARDPGISKWVTETYEPYTKNSSMLSVYFSDSKYSHIESTYYAVPFVLWRGMKATSTYTILNKDNTSRLTADIYQVNSKIWDNRKGAETAENFNFMTESFLTGIILNNNQFYPGIDTYISAYNPIVKGDD